MADVRVTVQVRPTSPSNAALGNVAPAIDQLRQSAASADRAGLGALRWVRKRLELTRHLDDPPGFYLLLAAASVALLALVGLRSGSDPSIDWRDALPWVGLCAAANVLPVPTARNFSLSMSSPVNIAVGLTLPTGLAALVVASSSFSMWELRGETTFTHALYNRLQLGLSTAAAATAAHVATTWDLGGPSRALLTVGAYHAANWVLVGAAESVCRKVALRGAVRRMLPPGGVSAVTYLVLGFLGFALAATLAEVGAWAVALLLLPLVGARHAVASAGILERAERAQRSLADRLIDERERERLRIAADIHDVVLQDLVAQQVVAGNLRAAIGSGRYVLVDDLADTLERGSQQVADELRSYVASLRRSALDEGGLGSTLPRFARSFSVQSGIDVAVAGELAQRPPLPVELLLYECSQELLTNVARHASATRIDIDLERVGGVVEMRVADDGVGFDGSATGSGEGLALLRDKVALVGGSVRVRRRDSGGAEVLVVVPVGAP